MSKPARALLLASQSPRRRELITLLGLPVRLTSADVDEESVFHADPAENARQTALLKAQAVAPRAAADEIVVASDTIVAVDGDVLGKPRDAAEATAMLNRLRDRVHHVHTALVLLDGATGTTVTDVCTTPVRMRPYTAAEIAAYVASGDPFDKAGGYAIQNTAFQPVPAFSDCFASVMGLPLCHLARALERLGVRPSADGRRDAVPAACQAHLDYACPVFDRYRYESPAGAAGAGSSQ